MPGGRGDAAGRDVGHEHPAVELRVGLRDRVRRDRLQLHAEPLPGQFRRRRATAAFDCSQNQFEVLRGLVARDLQGELRPGRPLEQAAFEVDRGNDGHVVDLLDHVAGLHACGRGRRTGFDRLRRSSARLAGLSIPSRMTVSFTTKPCRDAGATPGDEVRGAADDEIDGQREADVLGPGANGDVHADHFADDVQQRPAGVAGVDGALVWISPL